MPVLTADQIREQLDSQIRGVHRLASELLQMLEEGCTMPDFIDRVHGLDDHKRAIIAQVVRWSRARGKPIRADGQPDLRGKEWKGRGGNPRPKVGHHVAQVDLRKNE